MNEPHLLVQQAKALSQPGSLTAQLCDLVEKYGEENESLKSQVEKLEISKERLFQQSIKDQNQIAHLSSQLSEAKAALASRPDAQADGWLRDGSLLYRLTDGACPQNRDEINVTMADGSRLPEDRERRAKQVLAALIGVSDAQADERGEQECPHGVDDGACKQCYDEKAALAANQCVHAKGILGDDGGTPCCPLTMTPDASAPTLHDQFEQLNVQNHVYRRAMQKIMARLTELLDEDRFAEIENIVKSVGVEPPASPQPQAAEPKGLTEEQRAVLAKALARYDELTGSIQGCTDGGCLIRKPEGMHTNGGCRCARDHMKMQRAMYAANELRNALAEIERLERAKGE